MENLDRLTLAEMEEFVENNQHVNCAIAGQEASYGFIERVLKAQQHRRLSKGRKGIVKRYLAKITAFSRAQLTRLIGRWMDTRRIAGKPVRRPSFRRRCTSADIALPAEVDAAHEDLSGPAVRHLLQRAHRVHGNQKFARLAGISASHIYNLRRAEASQNRNHRGNARPRGHRQERHGRRSAHAESQARLVGPVPAETMRATMPMTHRRKQRFRLASRWNQSRVSGSSRIGMDS